VIPEALYKQVEPLDRVRHRRLHMRPLDGWSVAQAMNAVFVTVVEFADVCKEYAIVFVRAGRDPATGREEVVPVALTGLKHGENLYLRADGGWDARYVPAFLRRYPFALARADRADDPLIVIDAQWSGWVDGESGGSDGAAPAEPLFDAAGEPAPVLKKVQAFLDNFRQETVRTGVFGNRLLELGLLQEMRFDATLPSGEKLVVDGFLALDTKKFAELPDALLGELHRSGVLGLLHLQQVSLGNIQRLVERRIATLPAATS
jgi:hypothetical protein